MTSGTVSLLNVGAGDITLSFDNKNPAECLRASRIVKDVIRRGYALLVEVERNGQKAFERALDFDETKNVYIIADFDPVTAALADKAQEAEQQLDEAIIYRQEQKHAREDEAVSQGAESDVRVAVKPGVESDRRPDGKRGAGRKRKEIPAAGTRAVAVGRSAGG